MIDEIVQIVRHGLCCIFDLRLFDKTILYNATATTDYLSSISLAIGVELPEETISRTTPLELMIGITQMYAFVTMTYEGLKLSLESIGKLNRCIRLLNIRGDLLVVNGEKDGSKIKNRDTAYKIVMESLLAESRHAIRNAFTGALIAFIGIAFFWVFGHMLHFTEGGSIGGMKAYVDALAVMEVCLLPLMYWMLVDAMRAFSLRRETEDCAAVCNPKSFKPKSAFFDHNYLNATRYGLLTSPVDGWKPLWSLGVNPLFSSSSKEEATLLRKEFERVERRVTLWFGNNENGSKNKSDDDDILEKQAKIRRNIIAASVDRMEASIVVRTIEGYREIIFFIINLIAFYGYLMAVIAFYYPDREGQGIGGTTGFAGLYTSEGIPVEQPNSIQHLKFGYNNKDADWIGNFVGDFMWLIEPIVILITPVIITYALSKAAKSNTTAAAVANGDSKLKTE